MMTTVTLMLRQFARRMRESGDYGFTGGAGFLCIGDWGLSNAPLTRNWRISPYTNGR